VFFNLQLNFYSYKFFQANFSWPHPEAWPIRLLTHGGIGSSSLARCVVSVSALGADSCLMCCMCLAQSTCNAL
jgi:hypothetical protein